jgi:hypothetical protein
MGSKSVVAAEQVLAVVEDQDSESSDFQRVVAEKEVMLRVEQVVAAQDQERQGIPWVEFAENRVERLENLAVVEGFHRENQWAELVGNLTAAVELDRGNLAGSRRVVCLFVGGIACQVGLGAATAGSWSKVLRVCCGSG